MTTVKCFDPSIYYFMLILTKLRYVFCNRCVTLSLGFAKDRFANNSFNRDTPDDKFTLRVSLAS